MPSGVWSALGAAGLVLAACLVVASCGEAPATTVPATQDRPDAVSAQPVLVGTVTHIYDGDTIEVRLTSGVVRVRLHSIDTPEHDQPWGARSRAALASRVDGRTVSLDVVTQDRYDRLVAEVLLGDENINAWLVQQGYAWAYRHYLDDESYCVWEGAARAARRGLWSEPPQTWAAPWEWRAIQGGRQASRTDYSEETVANCILAMHAAQAERRSSANSHGATTPARSDAPPQGSPSTPHAGPCLIKGNISSHGKIYHVPGSASYDATRIDEWKGERWFCTEDEARAAGWRPPRN